MADGRQTSDVGRRTSSNLAQPWQVDATQNHGGAIGFPLAMVHFFKFQLGRSLTDITVRIWPFACN